MRRATLLGAWGERGSSGGDQRGAGLITPLFHITLPEDDGEDRHFAPLIPALEGMIAVNVWHIRRSLKRAQKGLGRPIPPLYASGVRYKEDPPGQENWKDCLAVLKDGHGDCLPLSTLVMRDDHTRVPLCVLQPGDRIAGDGVWTRVQEVMSTGEKPILVFLLSNGCSLRCSPEHRLFREVAGRVEELRAREACVGDDLVTPQAIPGYVARGEKKLARVREIVDGGTALCGDLTTDSGKLWLPESDVIVHNCDRLVSWRVAELRVAGVPADPIIKWQQVPRDVMIGLGHPPEMVPPQGISMVHVCVGWPGYQGDDRLVEDPSKLLGMGGEYTQGI